MQRRVLVTVLGMAIASLASACGQKSPLFIPKPNDNKASINVTRYISDNKIYQEVELTHIDISTTDGAAKNSTATGHKHLANSAYRVVVTL